MTVKKSLQVIAICLLAALSVLLFTFTLQIPPPIINKPCNVTLVTSYFVFRSKHTESEYNHWMKGVLSLNACLVVYAAESSREFIESTRKHPTKLHITRLHDAAWRLNHSLRFWVRQFELDPEASIHQGPQVYWVWALKAVFMRDTVLENPFNTEHFFWIDMGYMRDGRLHGRSLRSVVPVIPTHRVLFISVFPFKNFSSDHLGCGLWGGTAGAVLQFHDAYFRIFERLAAAGQFVGKDQTIINHVCTEQKQTCAILESGKEGQWFFMLPYLMGCVKGSWY